ncbi:MAG TPA: galactokinase [Bryobacteraceae bacterium]|nr:galactokinase [Bryobacteraceae bacterium]
MSSRVFRAPGRVNLIGEFTDYNDGFVMPAAVDFSTTIAATKRLDRMLGMRSANIGQRREFPLDDRTAHSAGDWSDYVRGVAVMLERLGHRLHGADLEIEGDVPMGAGLSSSASLEVATALALIGISGLSLGLKEIAALCQRAENEFAGSRCGIMDQFISCFGKAGRALLLDCRSLDYRLIPIPAGIRLVISNTMVRHQHATGEYNNRRADCEAGVLHFARIIPHVRALRDVTLADLSRYGDGLPDPVYRRCRHVISENARVERAAQALEQSDLDTLGTLMAESHRSLRDDFEVSCPELDLLVDLALAAPGIRGSRMTGGGFGGCTISLVDEDRVDDFVRQVGERYRNASGITPELYVTTAADGAREVFPSA